MTLPVLVSNNGQLAKIFKWSPVQWPARVLISLNMCMTLLVLVLTNGQLFKWSPVQCVIRAARVIKWRQRPLILRPCQSVHKHLWWKDTWWHLLGHIVISWYKFVNVSSYRKYKFKYRIENPSTRDRNNMKQIQIQTKRHSNSETGLFISAHTNTNTNTTI